MSAWIRFKEEWGHGATGDYGCSVFFGDIPSRMLNSLGYVPTHVSFNFSVLPCLTSARTLMEVETQVT